MRVIALNARAAVRPELGGVERWARELAARLPALGGYEVLRPPATISHRAGHAWEQVVLPARARRARLLLNPANLAPLAFPRNAVVIHDAAALRHPGWYSPALRPLAAHACCPPSRRRARARHHRQRVLQARAAGAARRRRARRPRRRRPALHTRGRPRARQSRARPDPPLRPHGGEPNRPQEPGSLDATARRLADDGIDLVAAGGERPQFAGEAASPAETPSATSPTPTSRACTRAPAPSSCPPGTRASA